MTSLSETTGAAEGQIFKTDTVGRVRVPHARREALLDEFERSGASGAQFAAYVGVKYSTFAAWVHKRRQQKAALAQGGEPSDKPTKSAAEPLRWWETVVEGQLKAANDAEGLQVRLPGGAQLHIASDSQAALAAVLLERLGRLGAKPC
jgi:hypothetical protein